MESGAKHIVQALLLGSVVGAVASHAKPKRVPIEPQARVRIGDDNRRVVDAEKQPAFGCLPLRVAFAGGELQDLERMTVGVLEVERLDSARRDVPIREPLRLGRCVLDLVLSEARIGGIHVGDDDRDVLEPAIVAA